MAKIFYNWGRVKRGDIVSFKYRSKDGRFLKRSVLVLEPKLQNEAKNPSSKSDIPAKKNIPKAKKNCSSNMKIMRGYTERSLNTVRIFGIFESI